MTWTGHGRCVGCTREGIEVTASRDHGERVLCAKCVASIPIEAFRAPSATGLDPPKASSNGAAPAAHSDDRKTRRVELTAATAIRSERLRWVWTGWMPRRSLVIVAGEKGLGKSLLTNARLPALITRGELDGELRGIPADVLIASAEDDWATVIKPRLMAHGADLSRVHRVAVHDENGDSLLTLPDDVPRLEAQIVRLRDAGRTVAALVIDPVGAFLASSTDTHRDASVRRALAPLAAMSERIDLVVLVVAHLTKDDSARLINRVNGASAFVNAARSVLALARDPGDPHGEQGAERVLLHVGTNWGTFAPTLAWRVEGRQIEVDDGSVSDVGYLVDKGETSIGVEDVQRGPDENATDAEEAIGQALTAGPRPSREVKAEVSAVLDCAKKTVERAAMRMVERGDLRSEKGGFPATTTWTLASRDSATLASRDIPEPPTVPTGSRDVLTGNSPSSGDSRDLSKRDVPTAGERTATDDEQGAYERALALVDEGSS